MRAASSGSPSDDTLATNQLLFGVDEQVLSMNAEGVRRDTECRPTGLPVMAFFQALLVRSSPDQRLLGRHPTEPNAEPTIVCGWADRTVCLIIYYSAGRGLGASLLQAGY